MKIAEIKRLNDKDPIPSFEAVIKKVNEPFQPRPQEVERGWHKQNITLADDTGEIYATVMYPQMHVPRSAEGSRVRLECLQNDRGGWSGVNFSSFEGRKGLMQSVTIWDNCKVTVLGREEGSPAPAQLPAPSSSGGGGAPTNHRHANAFSVLDEVNARALVFSMAYEALDVVSEERARQAAATSIYMDAGHRWQELVKVTENVAGEAAPEAGQPVNTGPTKSWEEQYDDLVASFQCRYSQEAVNKCYDRVVEVLTRGTQKPSNAEVCQAIVEDGGFEEAVKATQENLDREDNVPF